MLKYVFVVWLLLVLSCSTAQPTLISKTSFPQLSKQGINDTTLCGDLDGSGTISITDAVIIIRYIFAGGPAPCAPRRSVTLTWTAVGDDSLTGTASEYDIRYSVDPITMANWDAAIQVTGEPAPQVSGSQETFTVTGLSEGVTYYFAIKVRDDSDNWSWISNVAVN